MGYQNKKLEEIYSELNTLDKGLTEQESAERLKKFGLNEIKEIKKIRPLKIFIRQFISPVVWILVIALIISLIANQHIDAIIIGTILIINAILGFVQEYRAEKAIEALKKVITKKATVIRDGIIKIIPAEELVPGDIIILTEGEKIPADARLIETNEMKTNEASLTGESVPINKKTGICTDNTVGNMFNMVFSGTNIVVGSGRAVVTGTGMNTEIGKIATLLQETETPPTPLQKHLKKLGASVGIGVIAIAGIIYFLGVQKGGSQIEVLLSSLALAVAAVPEGLPAIITISLALGTQRMLKRKALLRNLPSAETLGSCTAICSDKTGTLTKGEMTVKKIFVDNKVILVSGSGYDPNGIFEKQTHGLRELLECGVLCNNAVIEQNAHWSVIGDPTEGALIVSAAKYGIKSSILRQEYKRLKENIFGSIRKMMSVVCEKNKKRFVFAKGAPEKILEISKYISVEGKKRKMTDKDKELILNTYASFGKGALRVLGFAYKQLKNNEKEEADLIFLGLQGMIDAPREEVKEAIEKCNTAGIRTIMITGDYEITAKAIAEELGMKGKVVTGKDLDNIDLDKEIENIGIFARVDPGHKLKIIEALQKKGHIVAMTGDGVNDAPALKKADIGISMGINGTDVAKESSQMVLLDDNFASIVNAVEEGRNIFSNIREFVEYLFSSNIGEVLTIFIALLIGLPLPLIAVQILWINLLTDGFPALALGVDPPEKGIMQRKPRKNSKIISGTRWVYIALIGLIMMLGTLSVYNKYLPISTAHAQTMAFTTLVMFQLFNAFNLRSKTKSLFASNPFSNTWLVLAVLFSLALQFAVIYSPLSEYFRTVALTSYDWVYVISTSILVLVFGEIVKFGKWIFKTNHSI